ncbi:MAG: tetratricopeptide repeat protein [Verrucomicrobiia bacterium]
MLIRASAAPAPEATPASWSAVGLILTRDGLALLPTPPPPINQIDLSLPGNRRETHRQRLGGGDGWSIIRVAFPVQALPRFQPWASLPESTRTHLTCPMWNGSSWVSHPLPPTAIAFAGDEPHLLRLAEAGPQDLDLPIGTPLFAGDGTVFAIVGPDGPEPKTRNLLGPSQFLVWLRSVSPQSPPLPWRLEQPAELPFPDPSLPAENFRKVVQGPPGPDRHRAAGALTQQFPNSPLAWFAAAIVLADDGNLPEATAAARRVTTLAPKQPAAWILLGRLWLAAAEPARALDAFNQALELGASPGSLASWVADAHLKAGDRRAAIAWLQGIVRRDPSSRDTFIALAKLHEAGREWDSALRAWLVAARMSAPDPELWERIARAYRALERPAEAAEAYAEMARLLPQNGAVWFNLGTQLLAARQFEPAEGALHRAAELLPDDPLVRLHHAHALARLNRLNEAATAYRETIRIDSTSVPAWFNLGVLLSAANQLNAAREAYQQVVQLDPKHVKAWANLADLEHRSGRTSERDQAMESLRQLDREAATTLTQAWERLATSP